MPTAWILALTNLKNIPKAKSKTCAYRKCTARLLPEVPDKGKKYCNEECRNLENAAILADKTKAKKRRVSCVSW